jgi:hypothetical protein
MRLGPMTFAVAAVLLSSPAPVQEYPSRPVLLVVPYAPGGGTETMARLLGRRLEQRLGKPYPTFNWISLRFKSNVPIVGHGVTRFIEHAEEFRLGSVHPT